LDKLENAWDCLVATGHAGLNLITDDVNSLADMLGVEEPKGQGPVFLTTLDMVLNHPCIQMIPGIAGAATILNKVISFLIAAWNIIQNPEPVINALKEAISKLIKAVLEEAESTVKKALGSVGASLAKHGLGIWRHLKPKLEYLANHWWDVIKEAAWNLIWPWPAVSKDLGEAWDSIKSAADNLWNLNFDDAIDDVLKVSQKVVSIAGSLYGWFSIAAVLVGAVVGGILLPGVGAIPGAAAGLAVAEGVGEGLLIATVAVEGASLAKAVYNLTRPDETEEKEEKDYEQVSSSGLTLAITAVMFLLSELAVKFAQRIASRVVPFFRRRAPEAPAIKGGALDADAAGESGELSQEQIDTENKKLDQRVDEPELPDSQPLPGEDAEPLQHGEARITKEGYCKICHSPCERMLQMAQEALTALEDLGEPRAQAYAENLTTRTQLLDGAIQDSMGRGTYALERESRFAPALEKLGNEVDALHGKMVRGDPDVSVPALDAIEDFGPGRKEGLFDNPDYHDPTKRLEKAEHAYEGTGYHTKVKDAVARSLPPGTAFTEDTIQEYMANEFRTPAKSLPTKSTGVDLYIFDHQRNLVTPVDITYVSGAGKHVAKLLKDVDKMRAVFERAGFDVAEPIEIEYVGQTFDEASQSIVDELRAFAHQ
jgi:hypothetical protein